jgi:predicted ATPase
MSEQVPYLLSARIKPDYVLSEEYPFNLPLIRSLDLRFTSIVTFFVGENGTGKSTVIEALASVCRLPVSGGSRNELSANHGPDAASPLAPALRSGAVHLMAISYGPSSRRISPHFSINGVRIPTS